MLLTYRRSTRKVFESTLLRGPAIGNPIRHTDEKGTADDVPGNGGAPVPQRTRPRENRRIDARGDHADRREKDAHGEEEHVGDAVLEAAGDESSDREHDPYRLVDNRLGSLGDPN